MDNLFKEIIDCKRILREITLLRKLEHPCVVNLIEILQPECPNSFNSIYVVMEYAESDLKKLVKSDIHLDLIHIKTMVYNLLRAVKYLHDSKVLHRDLKPANLFLMSSGTIKVIDFGESKDLFKPDEDGGNATTATIRGTPQYLSPILWKAHVVDGNSRFAKHNVYKSDIFSMGLLFYQMAVMEDVTGFNQKS